MVLGRPMIAEDFTRDSRVRRAMESWVWVSGWVSWEDGPTERACVRTEGIVSGRLRVERAVAARRYQVLGGRLGVERRVLRTVGVMIWGRPMVPLTC